MTFLDVLVQLVDKRVQLLPLLGGKLKCITSMDPPTQRAEKLTYKFDKHKRELSESRQDP